MKFDYDYNNDWISFVGSNGSGKTTLARFIMRKVPKDKMIVLNAGMERDWYKSAEKQNIISPTKYDLAFLHRKILEIITDEKYAGMMLVLDDVDNFRIKESDVMKSIFINQRRLNLGGAVIVRRLNWLPIEIYERSKYCFFGRQNSDYNIYYIMTLMGREVAVKMKSLKQYEFLAWENATNEFEIIKAPR